MNTQLFNQNTVELIEHKPDNAPNGLYYGAPVTLDTREIVHLLTYLAINQHQEDKVPYVLSLARPIGTHTSAYGSVNLINIELAFDIDNSTFKTEFSAARPITELVEILETMLRSTNCASLNGLTYDEIQGAYYSSEELEFEIEEIDWFKRRYEYDEDWALDSIRPLSSASRDKRLLLATFKNKIDGSKTLKLTCATRSLGVDLATPTKMVNLSDFNQTAFGKQRNIIHGGAVTSVNMIHTVW